MVRFLLLSALNLALPFLIYYFQRKVVRMWQRRNEPHIIDVTPEEPATPTLKLMVIGLVLLLITLIGLRFLSDDAPSENYQRSKTMSADY